MVHGLPAATSCAGDREPVDAALLMVPEGAIAEAFADMNAAGIGNAVVLTSGFAEVGAEGAAKQEALLAAARAQGVTLLGPNCLGFINYADRVPIWTTQPPMPVIRAAASASSRRAARPPALSPPSPSARGSGSPTRSPPATRPT